MVCLPFLHLIAGNVIVEIDDFNRFGAIESTSLTLAENACRMQRLAALGNLDCDNAFLLCGRIRFPNTFRVMLSVRTDD